MKMQGTKGFITLATGKEEYYILAKNLLQSYRHFSKEPLPFAILADRENQYTKDFDDVVLFPEGEATNSYLDKLKLGEYLPYDYNIFIDSDCLAYGDLNQLFEYFTDADDFSCFGRVLSLEDKTGWFEYENLGELQSKVDYCVGLHGGIYYMQKSKKCSDVFESALNFVPDYQKYKFKGKFETPGDEPLVALAMAVNHCKPEPFKREAICCYWEYVNHMCIDISKGKATVTCEPKGDTILLHWGTRYTRELEYKKQIELLEIIQNSEKSNRITILCYKWKYEVLIFIRKLKSFVKRVVNKVKRIVGIQK